MDTAALIDRIGRLRRERNAVILAHYYQRGDVQDIADFVGDSLDLSRRAAATPADVILFCGVQFMAETAKILSPLKTVLLPDRNAGCPMANMLTRKELDSFKAAHPGALVVAYVNCSAEIKAEADLCCTSANAVNVVQSLPAGREILFVPDMSLGEYVMRTTGRELVLWPGYCPTHHRFLARDVEEQRALHPGALVCVHPECTRDVVAAADFVGSTSQIITFCTGSSATAFIIGSETGMLHPLRKRNPAKAFFPLSPLGDCPNMKLTSLEKIGWCLEDNEFAIELDEQVRLKAYQAVEKMIRIG